MDDDEPAPPEVFPLSSDDLEQLQELAGIIRAQLRQAEPGFIRDAAVALLVLERLPAVVPDAMVTVGWLNDGGNGNREWADLTISEEEICVSIGSRFYEPGLGGDTETDTLFQSFAGGSQWGGLGNWFERARPIANHGRLTIDIEGTDWDSITWSDG